MNFIANHRHDILAMYQKPNGVGVELVYRSIIGYVQQNGGEQFFAAVLDGKGAMVFAYVIPGFIGVYDPAAPREK